MRRKPARDRHPGRADASDPQPSEFRHHFTSRPNSRRSRDVGCGDVGRPSGPERVTCSDGSDPPSSTLCRRSATSARPCASRATPPASRQWHRLRGSAASGTDRPALRMGSRSALGQVLYREISRRAARSDPGTGSRDFRGHLHPRIRRRQGRAERCPSPRRPGAPGDDPRRSRRRAAHPVRHVRLHLSPRR